MSAELREIALERGQRRSSLLLYRAVRQVVRKAVNPWLSVVSENTDALNLSGPTILAPVHRSNLDSVLVAALSDRRIRALGKQSLFETPGVNYVCAALGAIPVRRGEADRDSLKAAMALLKDGESMIVFPEGARQSGSKVGELFDGASWLAAKAGARVVPVGVAGTEQALPQGAKFLKRGGVAIVVGDPLDPPAGVDGRKVHRDQLSAFTVELAAALQTVQDRASQLLLAAN